MVEGGPTGTPGASLSRKAVRSGERPGPPNGTPVDEYPVAPVSLGEPVRPAYEAASPSPFPVPKPPPGGPTDAMPSAF